MIKIKTDKNKKPIAIKIGVEPWIERDRLEPWFWKWVLKRAARYAFQIKSLKTD